MIILNSFIEGKLYLKEDNESIISITDISCTYIRRVHAQRHRCKIM